MTVKTYVFIDASNIIYGAHFESWFIDKKKLLVYLKGKKIIIISSPKRTVKEIKVIAGKNHVDFGSLHYLIEYKKRGRP